MLSPLGSRVWGAAEEGPLALSPAHEQVRRCRDTRRGPETGTAQLEAGGKPPGRRPLTSTRRPMLAMCGEQSLTVSSFSICKGIRLSQSAGRRPPGAAQNLLSRGRAVGSPARGSQAVRPAQGQRPVSRAISGPQHSPPRLHGRRALARLQALISRVSLQGAASSGRAWQLRGWGANNPGVRQGTPDSGRRGDSPKVTRAGKAEPARISAVPTSQPAFCPLLLKLRSFLGRARPGKGAHTTHQAALHRRPAALKTLHKAPV